jgi:hypothetical protein
MRFLNHAGAESEESPRPPNIAVSAWRLHAAGRRSMVRNVRIAKWLALGAAALLFGRQQTRRGVRKLVADLTEQDAVAERPDSVALDALPAPVARYLQRALSAERAPISGVTLRQRGQLRTTVESGRWMTFTASHAAKVGEPGFVWDAQVKVMPFLHIHVVDSLKHGIGASRVRLMSVLRVGGATGNPELTSGALHRYLAEAVWYPAALLPSERLSWSAIDEFTALATLKDGATEVSLEFRFADDGEVESVFTPGRWGIFDGEYRQKPWEGHFSNYRRIDGVLIPMRGEVGWYTEARLDIVWRGEIESVEFASNSA